MCTTLRCHCHSPKWLGISGICSTTFRGQCTPRILIRDLVLNELDPVVRLAAEALRAVVDDAKHVLRRLAVGRVRLEPVAQHLDGAASEARQTGVQHQRHQRHYRLAVRSTTTSVGRSVGWDLPRVSRVQRPIRHNIGHFGGGYTLQGVLYISYSVMDDLP